MANILIVEDDPFLQKICRQRLAVRNDWILDSLLDGTKAIETIKTKKPDLVLLDLVLANQNGFEILQAIKTHDEIKHIPVIIMSTLEQESDIEKGLALGALEYLKKSELTFDRIIKVVEAYMSGQPISKKYDEEEAVYIEDLRLKCGACNIELPEGSKFCYQCGQAVA